MKNPWLSMWLSAANSAAERRAASGRRRCVASRIL